MTYSSIIKLELKYIILYFSKTVPSLGLLVLIRSCAAVNTVAGISISRIAAGAASRSVHHPVLTPLPRDCTQIQPLSLKRL